MPSAPTTPTTPAGLVIRRGKRLERALRDDAGAKGRGLRALVGSVEADLPPGLAGRVRMIAETFNAARADALGADFNATAFAAACDDAEAELAQLRRRAVRGVLLDRTSWIAFGFTALALLAGVAVIAYMLATHAP